MTEPVLGKAGWRRRAWLGGAAGAAALAGIGVAVWEQQRGQAASPLPGFWAQQWPTPAGGMLAMQSLQGLPLLVNFWATWCAPCVEELPLINAFYREHRANGWQVLALAIDQRGPVQKVQRGAGFTGGHRAAQNWALGACRFGSLVWDKIEPRP
jgi:thiol-disulfide isomerase/thioredoxin